MYEYKVITIYNNENLESLINTRAKDGWRVIQYISGKPKEVSDKILLERKKIVKSEKD